ncbi:DUF1232 domain-containing protein [Ramlibacter sp. USB13]|uniref:DUF1232 domain-containing protein n=1 Tax=Ramlibacter cellulosilyticus TaxID=2764187 RepID=A0A923MP57_9BURK|nr:DUF1232 domain-containing protein [Ramlibacter cellulosilyticus]
MSAAEFDDSSFWEKVKNFAKSAGREVIEKALWLYYAAQQPETPMWAKTVIYSALVYFVVPIDAIPDAIPVAGFTDDLGALAGAVATCAAYIDAKVKGLAAAKMRDWFGD